MNSSLDSATFVVGTLTLFGLAVIGALVVGVLAFLGASALSSYIQKVDAADAIVEMERERMRLEGMVKDE